MPGVPGPWNPSEAVWCFAEPAELRIGSPGRRESSNVTVSKMSKECRLFVGNIPFRVLESDLYDLFSQAGVVTSCNLMIDRATGRSRGFAFIEFSTPEEAQKAVQMFDKYELHGRALTVNIARPRQQRRR